MNGIPRWSRNKLINGIIHGMFAVCTAGYIRGNAAAVTSTLGSQEKLEVARRWGRTTRKATKKGSRKEFRCCGVKSSKGKPTKSQ